MSDLQLHLLHHTEPHSLAQVGADDPVEWAPGSSVVFSVTRSADRTSVICATSAVPAGVETEGPFHVFEVAGPLSFDTVGLLAGLLNPLAARGISVVTLSTYDTTWVLVPTDRADDAQVALRKSGCLVTPPTLGGI